MTFEEWYSTQRHQLSNEQVCRVIWNAATKAEREACAAVCESEAVDANGTGEESDVAYNAAISHCAAAIRSRTP